MKNPEHQRSPIATAAVLCAVLTLTGTVPAHAYLDPATGSYVIQILMAGLLGALFALKMFWRSVRTFTGDVVRRITQREPADG